MEALETYTHQGIDVQIFPDDSGCGDPRDADNVTTLFCSYPGHQLGDEQLPPSGFEVIECPNCQGTGEGPTTDGDVIEASDCRRCDGAASVAPTLHEWAKDQGAIAIAALFVYEHGGITMRAGRPVLVGQDRLTRADTASRGRFRGDGAGWDTSMFGFAIVTEEQLTLCCGEDPKFRTLDWISECIDSEVSEYAIYLEGRVYGYVVADGTPFDDSCWGFLGLDQVKEEANSAAQYAAQQLKTEIEEREEMAARDIETVTI